MALSLDFHTHSRTARADAVIEMAQKARLGGLIYLTGVLATITFTPVLSFGRWPEIAYTVAFCLLLLWREVAFRLVSRSRASALQFFWVYKCCFFVMAMGWITFVLYVLSQSERFEGVPALALVATAGFTAGTIVVLVPHIQMIKWFLAIIMLLPSPFLPFILHGTEPWFLIVIDTLAFFFLYDIACKQTLAYWQRVDLAEQLQSQAEELKISEENALTASRAKSDFLAKMSHEIRTPMNGVIGMVQLLDQDTADPKQKEYIEIIRSSGRALLSIINDILDFSKLEAGKVLLHPRPTDPSRVVLGIQSIFSAQAKDKGLALDVDIAAQAANQRVLIDGLRFQQILFNLVGNAIKFTDSGSVEIAMNYTLQEAGQVLLELDVIDTGVGIEAALQERIFEQFEQVDDGTSIAGTGLGLSICKRLVELMGGQISVSSEPGRGARFRVQLPTEFVDTPQQQDELVNELTSALTLSPSAREQLAQMRVLVVEDNPVNQQVIRHMLAHIGCAVELTDDGHQAIELLVEQDFELVLMDCDMPKIDGYQTTRLVRDLERQRGLEPVPIIALTAHVIDSVRQQCFEAGMNDFLIKPAKLPQLEAVLLKHSGLAGKAGIDQQF